MRRVNRVMRCCSQVDAVAVFAKVTHTTNTRLKASIQCTTAIQCIRVLTRNLLSYLLTYDTMERELAQTSYDRRTTMRRDAKKIRTKIRQMRNIVDKIIETKLNLFRYIATTQNFRRAVGCLVSQVEHTKTT